MPKQVENIAREILALGKNLQNYLHRGPPVMAHWPKDIKEPTLPQLKVLMAVHHVGQWSLKDLASDLGVTSGPASQMVDLLVEQGLLLREPNPDDRRQVRLSISPRMQTCISKMEDAFLQRLQTVLDRLPANSAKKWLEVLHEINEVIS